MENNNDENATEESTSSQCTSNVGNSPKNVFDEEDWTPPGNQYITTNNPDSGPRRSARVRHQFDPNHMPSGTLEMDKLAKQVGADSSSSDDKDHDSSIEELAQTDNFALCMALRMNNEHPRTWRQAIQVPHWLSAMEKEVEELQAKGTWDLVEKLDGMNVLPGVWVFRVKKDQDGKVVKYKARWCVNGSPDQINWRPEAIFSPVA